MYVEYESMSRLVRAEMHTFVDGQSVTHLQPSIIVVVKGY